MTQIALESLGKTFGDFTALADMNLTIRDGEFMALLGPSGCGKSTTMNMIAGMLQPSQGAIKFDGNDVVDIPMSKRGVGFVFQNYAIFTHMSVRDNLAYGLKATGVSSQDQKRRVSAIAELLQLTELLDRKAAGLSVNILQRLAIGRSAIVEPAIFLLDEPLSNVDAAFRAVMRTELKTLQQQFGQTMVYVTHDQLEAMTMADRIAVMDHGKLLQVGAPLEIYNNPSSIFVAEFIGSPGMNILPGKIVQSNDDLSVVIEGIGQTSILPQKLSQKLVQRTSQDIMIGFRPEQITHAQVGQFTMTAGLTERIGARTLLHLEKSCYDVKADLGATSSKTSFGEPWSFDIDPNEIHLFDPATSLSVNSNTQGMN